MHLVSFLGRILFQLLFRFVHPDALSEILDFSPVTSEEVLCQAVPGVIHYSGKDTICLGENTGTFSVGFPGGDPNQRKPQYTVFKINEVEPDNPGTDNAEFIEIAGPPDSSLSGLVLVFFNGNATSPQNAAYRVIDLDRFSTDSCGFFLVRGPSVADPDPSNSITDTMISITGGFLQNGPDAVAMYKKGSFTNGTSPVISDLMDAMVYHNATGNLDSNLLADLGQIVQYVDQPQASISRSPDVSGAFLTDSTPSPGQTNREGALYDYIWLLTQSDSILFCTKSRDTTSYPGVFHITEPGSYRVYGLSVLHGHYPEMLMVFKTVNEIIDTIQNGYCASLTNPYPVTVRPRLQFIGVETSTCSAFDSTGRFQVEIKWMGPELYPRAFPGQFNPLMGTRYTAGDTFCFRTFWIPGGDTLHFVLIDDFCQDTVQWSGSRFCDFCGSLKAPDTLSPRGLCTDEWYTLIPTGGGLEQTKAASGLFFSEYLEGSGNNKCLEIYNGTSDTIHLLPDHYILEIYFNGQDYPLESISLEGQINPGEVHILCHNQADSILLGRADQVSGELDFNGDDALVLKQNGKALDCIGQVGQDPGSQWGAGLTSTQDNTLIRNGKVCMGDSLIRDPFFPENEWTGHIANYFDELGKHQYTATEYVAESYIFFADNSASPGTALHIGDSFLIRLGAGTSDTIYYAAYSPVYDCSSSPVPLILSASPDNMVCKGKANVSLDQGSCSKTLFSDDLVENPGYCKFSIRLSYPFGTNRWPEGNIVDQTHVGVRLVYQAIRHDGNSCWGYLQVDNPVFIHGYCMKDTMNCYEWYGGQAGETVRYVPCTKDTMVVVSQSYSDSGCTSGFLGTWARKIHLKAGNIQSRVCKDLIHIIKPVLTDIDPPESIIIDCDLVRGSEPASMTPEQLIELQEFGIISANRKIVPEVSQYRIYPVPGPGCNFIPTYDDVALSLCGNGFVIRREWNILDWCTQEISTEIQYITIQDKRAPRPAVTRPVLMADTDPHDCMATFPRIRPLRFTDCSSLETWYEYSYADPIYPGRIVHFRATGITDLKLPVGTHTLIFHALDPCGHRSKVEVDATITDHSAPEAVCKSGLTASPDPASCWARVYAKDLDDGSRDNCKSRLHFAIASGEEIDHWREYWIAQLKSRLGPEAFSAKNDKCHALINHWINTWLFRDYADLKKTGTNQLVFRVHEAGLVPQYDPLRFNGGPHLWYCYNSYALARLEVNLASSLGQSLDSFWPGGQFTDSLLQVLHDDTFQAPGSIYEGARTLPVCEGNPMTPGSGTNGCPDAMYQDCFTSIILRDKMPPRAEDPEDLWMYCDGAKTGRACNNDHERTNLDTGSCRDAFNKPLGKLVIHQDGKPEIQDPRGLPYGYYGCNSSDRLILDEKGHRYESCTDGGGMPVYCLEWLLQDRFDSTGPLHYSGYFFHPVYDPMGPKEGRTFYIYDNCSLDTASLVVIDTSGLFSCGSGWIKRTWIFSDLSGNKTIADQKIYLRPRSDFEVIFPPDTAISVNLPILPESLELQPPQILDWDCESMTTGYSDEWLTKSTVNEFILLRTWILTDECVGGGHPHSGSRSQEVIVDDRHVADPLKRPCVYRFLKDGGDGMMSYTQVIQVKDTSRKKIGPFEKGSYPEAHRQTGEGNALLQNYPNPFNHQSMIRIKLEGQGYGKLNFYSSGGRLMKSIEKYWSRGNHEVMIDRLDIGSTGVYYYQFESDFFRAGRKMVVVK